MIQLPNYFVQLGWRLIGQFDSEVGSWLLHRDGEALLLEVPEGMRAADVSGALEKIGDPQLLYVATSHDHADHRDPQLWSELAIIFPGAVFIHPHTPDLKNGTVGKLLLGSEPIYFIRAPKHSLSDTVIVFRGIALTGDIELATLESVNKEVPLPTKRASFQTLASFVDRHNYDIHTTVSSHLNDLRHLSNKDGWKRLFVF